MRQTIKSPAPQLSTLKQFNLNTDMTGRHYALLATCEGQIDELVALSILKDLMEEDANKLTMAELRYLFMLVKINSLENDYTVNVTCTHEDTEGHQCGFINKYTVKLSDADLNPTPVDYKIPTIVFRTEDTEKEYSVIPPTMDIEANIFNYFFTEKGATPEMIGESKELSLEYTFLRGVAHLVDNKGNRLINADTQFPKTTDEGVFKYLDMNNFQTISHLYDKCVEVDAFGVQDKIYEIRCKKCKKVLVFRLPLLNGLTN